jgi:hypothetical protein
MIAGVKEALAIARGEADPATYRVHFLKCYCGKILTETDGCPMPVGKKCERI